MDLMAFAKIRQFITDKPSLLSTQLSKLEGNIEQALEALRLLFLLVGSDVVRISPASTNIANPYAPGQLVLVDTSSGNVNISVAAPTNALKGQVLPVVKQSGANTLTITVAPPSTAGIKQGKINTAASVSIGGIGPHYLICDGQDWWV